MRLRGRCWHSRTFGQNPLQKICKAVCGMEHSFASHWTDGRGRQVLSNHCSAASSLKAKNRTNNPLSAMPGVPRGQSPGIPAAPCTPQRREWFCPSSQIACRISCGKYAVDGKAHIFGKMRNSIEPDNATVPCVQPISQTHKPPGAIFIGLPRRQNTLFLFLDARFPCCSQIIRLPFPFILSKKRFSLVLRRTRDGIFAILTPYVEARYHRPGKARDSLQTDKTLSYQPNAIRQPRTFCCVQPVNALLRNFSSPVVLLPCLRPVGVGCIPLSFSLSFPLNPRSTHQNSLLRCLHLHSGHLRQHLYMIRHASASIFPTFFRLHSVRGILPTSADFLQRMLSCDPSVQTRYDLCNSGSFAIRFLRLFPPFAGFLSASSPFGIFRTIRSAMIFLFSIQQKPVSYETDSSVSTNVDVMAPPWGIEPQFSP